MKMSYLKYRQCCINSIKLYYFIMKDVIIMENLFVFSPYIRINEKNNKKILINHLTAHAHVFGENEKKLLELGDQPRSISFLVETFSESIVNKWIQRKILLEYNSVWKENYANLVEIETSTVCNWNCKFCPNTFHTREKRFQSIELFEEIIRKSAAYGYIHYVTLHGYNEPTIDPLFLQRVNIIRKYNLKLVLFTNGTGLTKEVLHSLVDSGVLRNIYFNLPSVDPEIFILRTGYHNIEKILDHIQYTIDIGIKVMLSVQGTKEEQLSVLPAIKKRFPNVDIIAIPSFDRAGILDNQYNKNIYLNQTYLKGCGFALNTVHVGIDGEMYLCLEDFYKKTVYANISDGSLSQILQCEKLQELKRKVWGNIPAEGEFICRKCDLMKSAIND